MKVIIENDTITCLSLNRTVILKVLIHFNFDISNFILKI